MRRVPTSSGCRAARLSSTSSSRPKAPWRAQPVRVAHDGGVGSPFDLGAVEAEPGQPDRGGDVRVLRIGERRFTRAAVEDHARRLQRRQVAELLRRSAEPAARRLRADVPHRVACTTTSHASLPTCRATATRPISRFQDWTASSRRSPTCSTACRPMSSACRSVPSSRSLWPIASRRSCGRWFFRTRRSDARACRMRNGRAGCRTASRWPTIWSRAARSARPRSRAGAPRPRSWRRSRCTCGARDRAATSRSRRRSPRPMPSPGWADHQPALVICGEDDGVTGLTVSKRLVDALQDARLVTIDAAGHAPHIERPDRLRRRYVVSSSSASAVRPRHGRSDVDPRWH